MNIDLQRTNFTYKVRIVEFCMFAIILLACNAEITQAPAPVNTDPPVPTSSAPDAQAATDAPADTTPTREPAQLPTDTSVPIDTSTPSATATATNRPAVPTATRTPSQLSFVWEIAEAGANPDNSDEWRVVISISASGGDGQYRYFHDALPVDDSIFEVFWEACKSKPGSMRVEDGAGHSVEEKYFLNAPYCNHTPTPTP